MYTQFFSPFMVKALITILQNVALTSYCSFLNFSNYFWMVEYDLRKKVELNTELLEWDGPLLKMWEYQSKMSGTIWRDGYGKLFEEDI